MNDKQINLLKSYKNDWNKFSRDVLRQKLDMEQQEILYAIQTEPRVSVKSGNARGKDFLAADASICFKYLVQPSKVINTAPTDRQAVKIMMSEIKRIMGCCKVNLGGVILEREIKFPGDQDQYLMCFKAADKSTEAWSGFHSPNIMIVATEATGLEQQTFNAIEGVLQNNSKLLLLFNPNVAAGESYRSTKAKDYKHYTLSSLDAVNVRARKMIIPGQVDWEWVNNKVERWCTEITADEKKDEYYDFTWENRCYRPNDLFRIKVLGQYGAESSDSLIPAGWLEASHQRWEQWNQTKNTEPFGRQPARFSTDVAGLGRDSTIHVTRRGRVVTEIKEQVGGPDRKTIHMETAGHIANNLKKEGIAIIDTIGEGAGVYSRLIEQGFDKRTISFKGSYSGKNLTDLSNEREFVNWRAACLWAVRDALDPQYKINLMLPPDNELDEELLATKFKVRSDGKIIMIEKDEIKKEIGRSPDKADALSQSFCPITTSDTKPNIIGEV